MDENLLDDLQPVEEDSMESTETGTVDTEHSENSLESHVDTSSDSVDSDDFNLENLYDTETGGIPVYIVQSDDTEEKLMDDELGGVPVVLTLVMAVSGNIQI